MFFIMYGNDPPPMSAVMQSFLKHIVARTMKQMSSSGNPSDFSELIASFFQVGKLACATVSAEIFGKLFFKLLFIFCYIFFR
jgi:hypothetical protein